MKVAFVFISMPVGGAEDFALTVAHHLPAGCAPLFVCLRSLGVIGEELRAEGRPIQLAPVARTRRWNVVGLWKLARWFREQGISVVHSQTYNAHTYALPAAWLAGCASVLHQQKTLEKLRPHRHWMMRWLSRRASAVVTLSERTAQDMARTFGVRSERLAVVPNVADRSVFRPAADRRVTRRALGLDPERFTIGGVASLNEVKNHEATLAMLAALRAEGAEFSALLIGEGKMRASLEARRRELGLDGVLALPGNQRPVTPWLQALDLLVLPSHWEGQPMILLQALACEIPILASRIEGNVAVLGPEHPGLFPLDQPAEYARLARAVLAEPGFRSRLLAHQRAVLAALPDAPQVAAELAHLYLRLDRERAR